MKEKKELKNKKLNDSSPLYFVSGSIFILTLLFGVYQVFALPYLPGAELNPDCAPGDADCTVAVEPALFNITPIDETDSTYTVIPADQIIQADTTNADVEILLPDIATPFTTKRTLMIEKTSPDNIVYIYANVTDDKINDKTAIQLIEEHQVVKLESVSSTQWVADFSFEPNPISPLSVRVATTAQLTATYDNGASGVGATLTGGGALGAIDTVTLALNDRLLVKNQTTNPEENGVYAVTVLNPFELTRTTDADEDTELDHQIIIPSAGSKVNRVKKYTQQTALPTVGTDDIIYTETGATVTQSGTGTQVSGQLAYWTNNARELARGATELFWNSATKMLGIGLSNPEAIVHIKGDSIGSALFKIVSGTTDDSVNGGVVSINSGNGGDGDNATAGGNGGQIGLFSGNGGDATGGGGGNASRIVIHSGDGGNDTDNGGNGGGVLIQAGNGGTGGTTNGHAGNVRINGGEPGELVGGENSGNIYINPWQYDSDGAGPELPEAYIRDKNVAIGVDANPTAKLDILENKEICGLTVPCADGSYIPEGDSVATRIQNDAIYTEAGTLDTRDRTNLEITSTEPADGFDNNYGIVVDEPTGAATENTSILLRGNSAGLRLIDAPDAGTYLDNAGAWQPPSSKALKENYTTVDKESILQKIVNIPIEKWNYISQSGMGIDHIGPYAEDFYNIFNIGNDNKHLNASDTAGIALVGIQALNEKVDAMGVELYIENEGPRDIAKSIANILKEIGVTIKDGVINAKKIQTDNIEMKDKVNGKTYCITMQNGQLDKTEGICE